MKPTTPAILVATLSSLMLGLSAQSPEAPFTFPIHSAEAAAGLDYGTWASGPDYKVSFHDGLSFYPVLGSSYPENLPLNWRSTSITIGGRPVDLGERGETHTDWRYEYHFAGITEAYDVRADGVEQTFVLHQRPQATGDLVITGALTTNLLFDEVAPQHGAIVFSDNDGNRVLSYGAATVIDASGDTLPITTSVENGAIQLHVPGTWLETASFPVVVDPLLSVVLITGMAGGRTTTPQIARDDSANELAAVYSRLVSANDKDLYSSIMSDDLTSRWLIFADITASWSTSQGDVAFVNGSKKWLYGIQRDFRSQSYKALYYKLHDSGDHQVDNLIHGLYGSAGSQSTQPRVGGATSSGTVGLIVFQFDKTGTYGANTKNSEIRCVTVDTANNVRLNATQLNLSTGNLDAERPSVVEQTVGMEPWLVTFQQFDNGIANDDWDCYVVRVDHALTKSGSHHFGVASSTYHNLRPRIAGRNGEYLVAFGKDTNVDRYKYVRAPELWIQKITWPTTQSSPLRGSMHLLRSGTQLVAGEVAFDNSNRSHFSITSLEDTGDKAFVDRVGYMGGVAESVEVGAINGSTYPAITFDDDHNDYTICWAVSHQVNTRKFVYPMLAQPKVYGTSCTTGLIRPRTSIHMGKAYAGNKRFELILSNGVRNSNAVLLLSMGKAAIDLGFIGMPGCMVNVDPAQMITSIAAPTSASGLASAPIPLPAPLAGRVYAQWVAFEQGNSLGLTATRGLEVEIK